MKREEKQPKRPPGRPRVERPCPHGCGAVLSAREMLVHKCGGAK